MKTLINVSILVLLLPLSLSAQHDDDPSLSYLRGDYKSVPVVAHVLVRDAEITGKVGGYKNWKVTSQVIESLKGRLREGDVIQYFQGTEARATKEIFKGEKIIFLLAEYEADKKTLRYSILENSTLRYTADRLRKLRIIRRSFAKRRPTR
ncbi:MAG: hypothetical protein ABR568_04715 [Pyrinomonadaceae bacterium]